MQQVLTWVLSTHMVIAFPGFTSQEVSLIYLLFIYYDKLPTDSGSQLA